MKTPRSGFRRAAATSWTLAGLGIAGVCVAVGAPSPAPPADVPGVEQLALKAPPRTIAAVAITVRRGMGKSPRSEG